MAQITEYGRRVQSPGVPEGQQRHSPYSTQAAGAGLSALGQGVVGLAEGLQRREANDAHLWTSSTMSQTRLDWANDLQQRQAQAQPGAPDFTPTLLKDFDEYSKKLVERAPSDTAKKFVQLRLDELRSEVGQRATMFEAKAKIDWRGDQVGVMVQNSQKLMNTDPGQYRSILDSALADIDAVDMPPVQKSEYRQKAIDSISASAVWSQIQKSPSAFLQSVGFYGGNRSAGDLTGQTGNEAFDALPFERRTQMFDQAVRYAAQLDLDVNGMSKKERDRLAEEALKEAYSRQSAGKLDSTYVEGIRPLVSAPEYKSLLKMLKGGGEINDAATFRQIQNLIYKDPRVAENFAFTAHRNGLITDDTLSSSVSRSREIARSEGPKSEYERSRAYIVGSLDPGPLVQDPVQRSRLAEALDTFDRWINAEPKRPDADVQKRGQEIVNQYKLVNLSDTIMALPSPRSGMIRRNPGDQQGMMDDIANAARKAKSDYEAKKIKREEYEQEMEMINRWRRAVAGVK